MSGWCSVTSCFFDCKQCWRCISDEAAQRRATARRSVIILLLWVTTQPDHSVWGRVTRCTRPRSRAAANRRVCGTRSHGATRRPEVPWHRCLGGLSKSELCVQLLAVERFCRNARSLSTSRDDLRFVRDTDMKITGSASVIRPIGRKRAPVMPGIMSPSHDTILSAWVAASEYQTRRRCLKMA